MNMLDYPVPSPAESRGGASGAALAALDWSRAQGPASPHPPPRASWGCTRSLVWAFLLPQTSSIGWRVGGRLSCLPGGQQGALREPGGVGVGERGLPEGSRHPLPRRPLGDRPVCTVREGSDPR